MRARALSLSILFSYYVSMNVLPACDLDAPQASQVCVVRRWHCHLELECRWLLASVWVLDTEPDPRGEDQVLLTVEMSFQPPPHSTL